MCFEVIPLRKFQRYLAVYREAFSAFAFSSLDNPSNTNYILSLIAGQNGVETEITFDIPIYAPSNTKVEIEMQIFDLNDYHICEHLQMYERNLLALNYILELPSS